MPRLCSCGEAQSQQIQSLLFGEQQDQEREDKQKEVVYLRNEGYDSDDATEQEGVLPLFSASMSLGVPYLNLRKLSNGVGSQSSTLE